MIIWCKIHVIYGFFTTETTILPQPWVGFEYHKSTGKSPRNEQKVWGKICFLSVLHSSGLNNMTCGNVNLAFIHSQFNLFDFSNNQGTFWTLVDDYLIFQINNK